MIETESQPSHQSMDCVWPKINHDFPYYSLYPISPSIKQPHSPSSALPHLPPCSTSPPPPPSLPYHLLHNSQSKYKFVFTFHRNRSRLVMFLHLYTRSRGDYDAARWQINRSCTRRPQSSSSTSPPALLSACPVHTRKLE